MESTNKLLGKIIVVVGPNASGKSNFGVSLAKKMNGEIISADSRQVYKGLDIGSGKVTKKEMMGVTHHCLDITNPKKVFSAYDFKKCAQQAIKEIWQKGKTPIIVGGTGFYIDAALNRVMLSEIPPNLKLRKKLSNYSTGKLFNLLKKLDPKRAKNIDKNNRVRLIRAIEVAQERRIFSQTDNSSAPAAADYLHSRRENSDFVGNQAFRACESFSKTYGVLSPNNILWIGIKRKPEELKSRIHNRLLRRLQGIVKEVKTLRKQGLTWKRLFDLGLEYRYVSLYLRGKLKKEEMLKKLEGEINKYSKRQMTYFKRNKEINWIALE
ncbi:MAG: tRNA (adenosine(37)-N6)-dimethylallyltransferase MiaA [Patescibacteria group bacterium]|mgnify:FL=1